MSVLARSTPYPPTRRYNERICHRCGITYKIWPPYRDTHLTHCKDCRHTGQDTP